MQRIGDHNIVADSLYVERHVVIWQVCPLVKFAVYRKRLPLTKALVRPVKLDPSLVLTTVTALVDSGGGVP